MPQIMKTKNLLTLTIAAWTALLQTSCQKQETGSQELIKQVETQVRAFHTADTSLNDRAILSLLWPEYTMLVDGNHISYNDVKAGTGKFMANTKAFYTQWQDLRIIPLGNEHAISSFIFTDSIIANDGTITRSKGPNTFVWEKRNEEWRLIYGDADHYPVE